MILEQIKPIKKVQEQKTALPVGRYSAIALQQFNKHTALFDRLKHA